MADIGRGTTTHYASTGVEVQVLRSGWRNQPSQRQRRHWRRDLRRNTS